MKVAILTSNLAKISEEVRRGPEIFVYDFVTNLILSPSSNKIDVTVFASGNSQLPVKVESIQHHSSLEDLDIGLPYANYFELALISKAFLKENDFDLYHVHIGNGEIILPFAQFIKKPILITLHSNFGFSYVNKYFSLFKELPNVFFISISNAQQKLFPELNYLKTIYHGINLKEFSFSENPKDHILWAGRGAPEKGVEIAFNLLKTLNKNGRIFPIIKEKHRLWLKNLFKDKYDNIKVGYDLLREQLIYEYQQAKLFLFPIKWEEPFGLVLIEAMACGTPVVAFARGSVPEIVKDGETGFIVNYSDEDIRGNWIVKKTGIDGIKEAIEKIYSMPQDNYQKMRQACRSHVEEKFSIDKMIDEYRQVYREVIDKYNNAAH